MPSPKGSAISRAASNRSISSSQRLVAKLIIPELCDLFASMMGSNSFALAILRRNLTAGSTCCSGQAQQQRESDDRRQNDDRHHEAVERSGKTVSRWRQPP